MENRDRYLGDYARQVLADGGAQAMVHAVEDLAGEGGVAKLAPVELGDLRASGHPSVTSNGEQVFDRPPAQHRLSKEELKVKQKAIDALHDLAGDDYVGHVSGSGLNPIARR